MDSEDIKNTGQTGLEGQSCNFSHPFAINLPKNCTNIPENWLVFEILALGNYWTGLDKIQLHDPSGNKMSIRQFVEEYEKTDRLVLYFSKPDFTSYHSEVFGTIQILDGNGKKHEGNYRTVGLVPYVLHSSELPPESWQGWEQLLNRICPECNGSNFETMEQLESHIEAHIEECERAMGEIK